MYKILSIGNFTTGWDGSICDEEHIAKALEDLGHDVTRKQRGDIGYPPDDYDFTLIAQWDGHGDISQLPRPIVYWAFDYQADGQPWHDNMVQNSDLYLSKRFADSRYSNWQWLSQDFAPQFLNKDRPTRQDIDVLFTGSYLPWATERNDTLKAIDKKFSLTIHSFTPDAWKAEGLTNVYGPVMDEALIPLVARAKINISIDHTIERGYWSDRNSQIIACGGFCLTRYIPPMEAIFRHNVIYFHNIKDCLEQIEWWLEHDEDREVVSNEAYMNSAYFKVKERVADMLEIVAGIL